MTKHKSCGSVTGDNKLAPQISINTGCIFISFIHEIVYNCYGYFSSLVIYFCLLFCSVILLLCNLPISYFSNRTVNALSISPTVICSSIINKNIYSIPFFLAFVVIFLGINSQYVRKSQRHLKWDVLHFTFRSEVQ